MENVARRNPELHPILEVLLNAVREASASAARLCARILDDSKMDHIRVIDVGNALQITDYFVVASGRSPRHVKSACDEILRGLRSNGTVRRGMEGYQEGKWVLIDFSDIVVHLFIESSREFYDLEHLWGDCPSMDWSSQAGGVDGPLRLRSAGTT